MVAQQDRAPRAESLRHRPGTGGRSPSPGGAVEDRHSVGKQQPVMGKQRQSLIGCTQCDRMQRVSMDRSADVGTGTIRLCMHDRLEVRPRRQVALLLVQCNGDDVLCENMAEGLSLPLAVEGAPVWPADARVT